MCSVEGLKKSKVDLARPVHTEFQIFFHWVVRTSVRDDKRQSGRAEWLGRC